MQLYGLDANNLPVYALNAKRQVDYECPECRGIIRLREGEIRESHFYHINPPASCRQNGKSLTHLNVQNQIASQIPDGECVLEKIFPEINRIADLYWEKERIVFEVQCSPMSKAEMLQRTKSYRSIGCEIVWILHERNYNRFRMSALEQAIAPITHYFSDMTPGGEGIIYDQWSLTKNGCRAKSLPKMEVQFGKPCRNKTEKTLSTPFFQLRQTAWSLYFEGDLLELSHTDPNADYIRRAAALDVASSTPQTSLWKRIFTIYETWLNHKVLAVCKKNGDGI